MSYTDSTIFVIRHGEFDKFGRMTDASFAQARDLGQTHLGGYDLSAIVISSKARTFVTAAAICQDIGEHIGNCVCFIADDENFDRVKEELRRICRQIIENDRNGCGGNILMVTHLPILMAFNKEAGENSMEAFLPLSGLIIEFDPATENFILCDKIPTLSIHTKT